MITEGDVTAVRGRALHGPGGTPLGIVSSVYRDVDNGEPLFALVDHDTGQAVVPLVHADLEGPAVVVPYVAEQLRTAPPLTQELDLTPEQEQRLFEHYGIATAEG